MKISLIILQSWFLVFLAGCQKNEPRGTYEDLTQEFREYWYTGVAELNSYKLEQVRYGERREGISALIFVIEPFSDQKYVKVNKASDEDVSILKMNFTKKFLTGIYPYSMMTSVFHPVWEQKHALKVTSSVQEWCGQAYTEILNKGKWKVSVHSYFEDESKELKTNLTWLEDELWTLIRIEPERLPLGDIQVIPGLFYQRLKHNEMKPFLCEASLDKKEGKLLYSLDYPVLNRTLTITFSDQFPWSILSWKETYPEGGEIMTSSGELIRQINTAYWNQNSLQDTVWRDSLFSGKAP